VPSVRSVFGVQVDVHDAACVAVLTLLVPPDALDVPPDALVFPPDALEVPPDATVPLPVLPPDDAAVPVPDAAVLPPDVTAVLVPEEGVLPVPAGLVDAVVPVEATEVLPPPEAMTFPVWPPSAQATSARVKDKATGRF
jgi:hypothetical protein